ncbi:MAG TPA: aldehyde dehydrogenase family protein, partial [Anaerolineales bacterium]|nr:aldehyde dehydrogenase family protein [Anaerolineales bacterium]
MINHFIDNQFVPSLEEETFPTLNPADNRVIAQVASGSARDANRAVAAARRAFDSGPWPRLAAAERAKALRVIGDLIEKYADEIADIEIQDTGVPVSQIKKGAIPRAAQNFFFFAEMATKIGGESYPKD